MELGVYEVEAQVEATHWWFRGRRRILRGLLDAALGSSHDLRTLDVGFGTGANAPVLAARSRTLVGVDFSADALVQGRQRHALYTAVVAGDVLALPFRDGSFELVTALDLLEHLDDDDRGVAELLRVVAPGGLLIVFVPAHAWLWGLHDDLAHHRRRYTAASLRALFADHPDELERLTSFNLLLLPPIFVARQVLNLVRPRQLRSENQINGPLLNLLLSGLFALEAPWLARRDLPLGVSLVAVVRRR
ncbi:MAG: class I SAM-dependent methyltransferase [Pseudomonadota bacterium]